MIRAGSASPDAPSAAGAASLVFIGGGPRAALILERLAAGISSGRFRAPLQIHVVEPHSPGSGRIWRRSQSPQLLLNSMAADITMFTDDSVQCAGPARPGPGLLQWCRGVAEGTITDVDLPDADLAEQACTLEPTSFPSRRLHSLYLEWFFRRTAAELGPQVSVTHHRNTAVGVRAAGGSYAVALDSGTELRADAVVAAVGHTDSVPSGRSRDLAGFAARHRLFHVPPAYTNDVDFSALAPGQDAVVTGMGLAFIDLVVLLMEGRGGSFRQLPGGALEYRASGREPRLWAGSRRGVPYRSKITAPLQGEPVAPLRYLTAGAVGALVREHGTLDFYEHLWPLAAKDAALAYYRELFTGHPARVAMAWPGFERAFDAVPWYSAERRRLVAAAVPAPADHLEFEDLDRPLAGRHFADLAEVQDAVAGHIRADLRLRDSGAHSETLGLFYGLLNVYAALGALVPPAVLTPASRDAAGGWWHGFFSHVDSGPPAHRLRELLALHDAGLLHFLGPGLEVAGDEERGMFTARSPQTGASVHARALIEARLPEPSVAGSLNPALSSLAAAGLGCEDGSSGKLLVDARGRMVGRDGHAAPRLYAVGAAASSWGSGAFARPHSNAASFRESDALARLILADLERLSTPVPAGGSVHRLDLTLRALHASAG
ncbi:FAD/NAD(P)-binding protein [Arthrobacter sp. NPDC097144]|uniref:FAD/NAD(P)-binding protein n=1 Tax=Arthrobacter sp. NPDC097144 TaxID=3363946 RepID=UPI0037F72B65